MPMLNTEFIKCSEDYFAGIFKMLDVDNMGECTYIQMLEEIADELLPGYLGDLGLMYPVTDIDGHDVTMHYLQNKQ